ncbi:MAG: hypothetical protein HRU03_02410 [Nanoarchaeales archaeon]|nr:hypothetical protein [Nanoarchaeales archaeon]
MVKILVFGDSIGWGAFDVEKAGWVERLKINYLKTFKTKFISVYNLCISGDTTTGVVNRIESSIKTFESIDKEELILMYSIGTNDASYLENKQNFEVPINVFKKNIQKIIDISKKHSTSIVFTNFTKVNESKAMPWVDFSEGNLYWENKELENYQNKLEIICKNNEIEVINLWDLLVDKDLPDGIHPNDVGHEKIYKQVKYYLENSKLLK